jgi:glutamine amidotransferase PdxT
VGKDKGDATEDEGYRRWRKRNTTPIRHRQKGMIQLAEGHQQEPLENDRIITVLPKEIFKNLFGRRLKSTSAWVMPMEH